MVEKEIRTTWGRYLPSRNTTREPVSTGKRESAGWVAMAGGMILAGSSVVSGKWMVGHLPVSVSGAAGLFPAVICLLPIAIHQRRQLFNLERKQWLFLMLQALFGMFLYRLFLYHGLNRIPAAQAGVITAVTPVFTAILAVVFLKERLHAIQCAGLFLAVAGMASLALTRECGAQMADLQGYLFILASALCESLLAILGRKGRGSLSVSLRTFMVSFFSFFSFFVLATVDELSCQPGWATLLSLSLSDMGVVAYNGIFVTWVAYLLFYYGIDRIEAGKTAVLSGLVPATGVVLSTVVLHESFGWGQWMGLTLVFSGILAVTAKGKEKRKD